MNTMPPRHGNSIVGVLATLAVIIVIACGLIYAMGYATVENTPQATTIEVDTQQMKDDASKTVEEGKKLLNDAGESIQEGAEDVQESVNSEPDDAPEVDVEVTPQPAADPATSNTNANNTSG